LEIKVFDVPNSPAPNFLFVQKPVNHFPFGYGMELQISQIFRKILLVDNNCLAQEEDCLVLDIGMNSGFFSQLSMSCGAKVVAVEPQQECHFLSSLSTSINKFDHKFHSVEAGAWFEKIKIQTNVQCDPGFAMTHKDSPSKVSVGTIVLDDYLEKLRLSSKPIQLVKIDTEGAEIGVLKGLMGIIRKQLIDNFVIEIMVGAWPGYGFPIKEASELFKEIASLGYEIRLLMEPHFPYSDEILAFPKLDNLANGLNSPDPVYPVPMSKWDMVVEDRRAKFVGHGSNLWLTRREKKQQ